MPAYEIKIYTRSGKIFVFGVNSAWEAVARFNRLQASKSEVIVYIEKVAAQ